MRYPLTACLLALSCLAGCGGQGEGESSGDGPSVSTPDSATAGQESFGQAGPTPRPDGDAPDGMVWVPGGDFTMGSDDGGPYEAPAHAMNVAGFWMDQHEVTNRQFRAFVSATGYVTVAEQAPRFEDFPTMTREQFDQTVGTLAAGAMVFVPPARGTRQVQRESWWAYVPGASWRQPGGQGTSIDEALDHPVVHVCWEDAAAYAKWAGKALPTEAQWEFAAKGGANHQYIWGDAPEPGGDTPANLWQGTFPFQNTMEDGHLRTAPVKSYPPNAYGLYDLAGNVREWTGDWWDVGYYRYGPAQNPPGPANYYDPSEPDNPRRAVRGGSYLHDGTSYAGMRPTYRFGGPATTAFSDLGFRCVVNP